MHLSETGIVQNFDGEEFDTVEFKLKLIGWIASATTSEMDVLCAELLDGFESSTTKVV